MNLKYCPDLKQISKKTALMRLGNLEGKIPENIRDLGFTITNSIKLLGFLIRNRGDIVTANFDPVKKKLGAL